MSVECDDIELNELLNLYSKPYPAGFIETLYKIKNADNNQVNEISYDKKLDFEIPDKLISTHLIIHVLFHDCDSLMIDAIYQSDNDTYFYFLTSNYPDISGLRFSIDRVIVEYFSYVMMDILLYKWNCIDSGIFDECPYLISMFKDGPMFDMDNDEFYPETNMIKISNDNKELTIEECGGTIMRWSYKDDYDEIVRNNMIVNVKQEMELTHYFYRLYCDAPSNKSARF